MDVSPVSFLASPLGRAVFGLEKALPVVSGERALGSIAKGGFRVQGLLFYGPGHHVVLRIFMQSNWYFILY